MENFFCSNSDEDRKKRSSPKTEHFFPSNLSGHLRSTLICTPESNYWGDADVDHTQTIWGDTVKLLGGYIPHPPRVSAPLHTWL